MIKETDPNKEQTSRLNYAPTAFVHTAKFQGSIPTSKIEAIKAMARNNIPKSNIRMKKFLSYIKNQK